MSEEELLKRQRQLAFKMKLAIALLPAVMWGAFVLINYALSRLLQ